MTKAKPATENYGLGTGTSWWTKSKINDTSVFCYCFICLSGIQLFFIMWHLKRNVFLPNWWMLIFVVLYTMSYRQKSVLEIVSITDCYWTLNLQISINIIVWILGFGLECTCQQGFPGRILRRIPSSDGRNIMSLRYSLLCVRTT